MSCSISTGAGAICGLIVAALERWIIAALASEGIAGRIVCGKIGVWVETAQGPAKIAAIGVRVRRWVSFHGLAINVAPDLGHFGGIVPCGLAEPVTSIVACGGSDRMADIDAALQSGLEPMLKSLPG